MKLDPQLRTLKAIKPHKYGTRHLVAGEEYEAPPRHAVALVAARKAQFADDKWARSLPKKATTAAGVIARDFAEHLRSHSPATESEPTEVNIDDLRLQATQLGINVDGRWGVHRLRSEIEQAKSR